MQFFSALFDKLIIQLSYSSTPELIDLLNIPGVKIGRARQLYSAGYCRVVDVAQASEQEMKCKIDKINARQTKSLISAAKNLLQETGQSNYTSNDFYNKRS